MNGNRSLWILIIILIIGGVAGYWYFTRETDTTDTTQETTTEDMDSVGTMTEEGYMDVTVLEAYEMIQDNPDLIIIDVSPNYARGHLPGAVNYYVGDGSLDDAIPNLDPSADYLVYCHTDSASILGATKLVDAGFKNIYRLIGNYSAWVDAGYDVEI